MNINSNPSVQQANQRAKQQKKVEKDTKAGNKRIADKHAHRAIQERDQRRRTPNINVTEGYSNGTIQDANKVNLDKALSWYGLSNGLGQMTNISDQMRNSPQFGMVVISLMLGSQSFQIMLTLTGSGRRLEILIVQFQKNDKKRTKTFI